MAFHPDYATKRKFYVYYTDPQGDMTVAEYLRDAVNPDIADPLTRRVVIEILHPGAVEPQRRPAPVRAGWIPLPGHRGRRWGRRPVP